MARQRMWIGGVVVLVLGMSACGGSSSPTSPSSTTGTPPIVNAVQGLGWTFTPDPGTRYTGIGDPNILQLPTELLIYPPGNQARTTTDGLTFTTKGSTLPVGTSFSFVKLADGRYRCYSLEGSNLISSISTDGWNWTKESGTRIALNNIGVPFVAEVGGGYRVFYVSSGGSQSVMSAFSSDGLSFTTEGARVGFTTVNQVDPSVTRLTTGDYLMTFSVFDIGKNSYSRLYLASSPDSLTWTIDANPIVSDASNSLADPSALVSLGNNRYRFYYASCPQLAPFFTTCDTKSGVISR